MERWLGSLAVFSVVSLFPVSATLQDKPVESMEAKDRSGDKKVEEKKSGDNASPLDTGRGDAAPKDAKSAAKDGGASPEAREPKSDPQEGAEPEEGGMSRGTYAVRLRDLEDRINRLKEQIFRSKARLSLLAETVLDRKIAGAKAVIVFRNEMGGSFRLAKATFLLDGAPVFNETDEAGSLAERETVNLFDGPVMPGEHTLSVILQYRGHGYGIFSYLRGYSFKTRSSRSFTVHEGKSLKIEVVGYEKGGVTTPLEDRPDVRYIMSVAEYEPGAVDGEKKR